jgi:hypothetical protein
VNHDILAIVGKLKGKGKADEPGETSEERDSAGEASGEAENAAMEDLFSSMRGRAPSEKERDSALEAFKTLMEACGYGS